MNISCPKCNSAMVVVDRQGVQIDYCTGCHGVFLDRGELDRLIGLSNQANDGQARNWSDDDPPGQRQGFFGRMFDFLD